MKTPPVRRSIRAALAAGLAASALAVPGVASADHDAATYRITITNETGGQWLTPPNWALHESDWDLFRVGRRASHEVQAVAENGGVPVLAGALATALDDTGRGSSGVAGGAPIAPGDSVSFEVTTSNTQFSLLAMVICTNDGFAGLNSRDLPTRAGQTRTLSVRAYDAGTERNTEVRGDLVPAPFCGEGDGATMSDRDLAEHKVIRPHNTIRGVADLDASFDWDGPVASVAITRHG